MRCSHHVIVRQQAMPSLCFVTARTYTYLCAGPTSLFLVARTQYFARASFPFCLQSSKVGHRRIFAVGYICLLFSPSNLSSIWTSVRVTCYIKWEEEGGGWTRRLFCCSFCLIISHAAPQDLGERKAPTCLARPYFVEGRDKPVTQ